MADGNGGPLAGLHGYFKEIDRQDDELAELHSDYMEQCKGPRGQIREVMASAKEAGVNMIAFREALAVHRADRAHEKRLAAMEPNDAQDLNRMMVALGMLADTPLGEAAIQKFESEALPGL